MTDPADEGAGSDSGFETDSAFETDSGFETDSAFETDSDRLRRRLRTRPADRWPTRTTRAVTGLFRSDEFGRRLTEAAAGAQSPVTTGRRIAVVGSRGGSGRTTTTALLARLYAALRQDPVAAVDMAAGRGTLALRLGAERAPSLAEMAATLNGRTPANLAELTTLLGAASANLWVAGSRQRGYPGPGAPGSGAPGSGAQSGQGGPELTKACIAVSRYCLVAVYDGSFPDSRAQAPMSAAGAGTGSAGTLEGAHAAVFVAPASVSGIEDARWHAADWAADPRRTRIPLLTVLTQTDARSPFDAVAEARRLTRSGIRTLPLRYDRHLAGGVELNLSLLSRQVRLEATIIAAEVLAAATGNGPA